LFQNAERYRTAAGKSEKISEYIGVFAAVFGYLELAMGSLSYLQKSSSYQLDYFVCEVRDWHAIPLGEPIFETKKKDEIQNV
jgi:hypothetical protein